MEAEARKKLAELIDGIKFAMLTTVTDEGALHSRPMATQEREFDGELWFFTSTKTHKVQEIERDHHVNVAYADPSKNRWVSVAGIGRLVRDRKKAEELWNPLLKAWFPDGLDSPDLVLLHVTPLSAEYWDSGSKKMVQLIGLAKALLTRKPYEASRGEHDRLDLSGTAPPSIH